MYLVGLLREALLATAVIPVMMAFRAGCDQHCLMSFVVVEFPRWIGRSSQH